ncbi:MAG: ATP-binding protein, partial [Desulfobacterales bacterium]|nr:ATP-binding protein [Desulfobacterales bacterium]
MPVGRIQSVHMFPLSFDEFSYALGEEKLCAYIQTIDLQSKIEPAFVERLEQLFRHYMLIGGMPKVVDAYCQQVFMEEIQRLQSALIRTYADDFAKYAVPPINIYSIHPIYPIYPFGYINSHI